MKQPTITLCLIAKNEAHNLPRLFDSIRGCFDAIHLVDTGSTDDTVNVAEKLGAKVFHFDWINDFGAARNFSISHVDTDYWMWLDCDDILVGRDEFLKFKRTSMGLGSVFYLSYHYAHDEHGNPVCKFIRERILKTSFGFEWKDPIHEGVNIVDSSGQRVPGQLATSFHIKHCRTADELNADRSRNISILEKLKHDGKLSTRLWFYYGKELFDHSRYAESSEQLTEVLKKDNLELHDRIMALQYLCFALLEQKRFDEAKKFALIALNIDPCKAEFYIAAGDSFLHAGNTRGAIPFYHAAKNCFNKDADGYSATYSIQQSYDFTPRLMLGQIYYRTGEFEKAQKELEGLDHDTAKNILKDIANHFSITERMKTAINTDEIVFTCLGHPYPFDEEIYKTKGIGGSETALVEMAKHLHEVSGRKVIVFQMRNEPIKAESGVEYKPLALMGDYFAQWKPYLHIAWRHSEKLTDARTVVWSHDLTTLGAERTHHYDKIIALSEFHSRYLNTQQNIPFNKMFVSRNGIEPKRFENLTSRKNTSKVIWPNSPDRGLERAILIIDEVIKEIPDVTLDIFYGMDHWSGQMEPLKNKLFEMINARPWIKYWGNVGQQFLAEKMSESAVWLYPANFIETFCITGIEALCCKCYPVVRDVGALENTMKQASLDEMADLLDLDCSTPLQTIEWARRVINAINEQKWQNVNVNPNNYSWRSVALEWTREFNL